MAFPLGSRSLVLGRLLPWILSPLLAAAGSGPARGATIESLGLLEGGEFTPYGFAGATPDASVIVGNANVPSDPRPFRWTAASGPRGLGALPGGDPRGHAAAVSADGRVVVGHTGVFRTAFRWTEEVGMVRLVTGLQINQESFATAVSADGGVVVGYFSVTGRPEAFRWQAPGGWTRLVADPPDYLSTQATAVSADGAVVVGSWNDGAGSRIFLWTEADGLQTISGGPGSSLTIRDMTPDASMIVGSERSSGSSIAFRWTQAGGIEKFLPWTPADGESSHAALVSADGRVIAGTSGNIYGPDAFVWTAGDEPLVLSSGSPRKTLAPTGISGDGSVVVGLTSHDVTYEVRTEDPWIWDGVYGHRLLEDELAGNYGLDLEGRRLTRVAGISSDGLTIFGTGKDSAGGTDLWIARLGGCRDTQEEAIIAGVPIGPRDPAVPVILDGSASNAGRGDDAETITRRWEVAAGPAALSGPADGPTIEVRASGLGTAVVRLVVDDASCTNPASSEVPIHFCDVRRARNAVFRGRCDLAGSEPPRLSADGGVALGLRPSTAPPGHEATRWTPEGGEVGLGDLPRGEFESRATDLSADGSVIVGVGDSGNGPRDVFRWTEEDGMRELDAEYPYSASADGEVVVSADGSVLVWTGGGLPVYWTEAGGIQLFGDVSNTRSYVVRDLSDDGTVLLVQDEPFAMRLERDSLLKPVGDLLGGAASSTGNDMSADGTVIVGVSSSARGTEAFQWTSGHGSVGLGDLPGGEFASEALAVTADGAIIVGRGTTAEGAEAFIWDAERGMRSLKQTLESDFGLDLTGWRIESAEDISADGLTIVGHGVDPSGSPQTWIARLDLCGDPPEIARIDGAPTVPVSTSFPVSLDGSRSTAWPGEASPVLSYGWEVVGGEASIEGPGAEATVLIRASLPGAVRVRLSVDDGGCGGQPALAEVEIVFRAPSAGNWLRGDANGDSSLNISDPVHTLNYLFSSGAEPECLESTDSNGDGKRDLSDAIHTLTFLFAGGASPGPPFPDCDDFAGCEDRCL